MAEAKINPKIFAKRKTSWESKPKNMFSGETIIIEGLQFPIEYKVEAERNWERFKRDYMAIPSLALEPYFKQWDLVLNAIDPGIFNPITKDDKISGLFRPKANTSYYMHIDLSLTTDATGIAMCHREDKKIIVDLIMGVYAEKGKEIDLASIRAIVYGLKAKGFSIVKCTFDQFQSASSIQEFNKMGVNAELLSVDRTLAPYETLKEGIYMGVVKMYRNDDFLMEIRRLELIEGKKVDHPANSSKDLADAVAGAVYNCVANQNEISFWFAGDSFKPKTHEEAVRDASIVSADGLVPYGYYRGRRGVF